MEVRPVRQTLWGEHSLFSRFRVNAHTEDEILPTLTKFEDYKWQPKRLRFEESIPMPNAMKGSQSLDEQQDIIKRVLRILGSRYLRVNEVPDLEKPFHDLYSIIHVNTLPDGLGGYFNIERVTFPCLYQKDCNPEDLRPPIPSKRNDDRVRSKKYYVRVNLTGRRAANTRGIEWFHRLLCWIRHGPPPGNLFDEYRASHLCGNSGCLSPMHLAWLTKADDIRCRKYHHKQPFEERILGLHIFNKDV